MGFRLKNMLSMVLAAAISCPVLLTGCAIHGRVYDSYTHQYRRWAPESGYYIRWENENNLKHERYRRRDQRQQEEYWRWRDRNRSDRDRDRDRDHGRR